MKTKILLLLGVVGILSGCSSVTWEKVAYRSFANEINLENMAKINILTMGENKGVQNIAKVLSSELQKSGQFVIEANNPDYWLVLSSNRAFRIDDNKSDDFNRKVFRSKKEHKGGGNEIISYIDYKSSSSAKILSVAIYCVKTLTPVHYFDVVIYDSDFKEQNVRQENEYAVNFAAQAIQKIKEGILIQNRTILTALPNSADSQLKRALLSGSYQQVSQRIKTIAPQPFEEFIVDVNAGRYNDKQSEKEQLFNSYYILALAVEKYNFDVNNLKKLHNIHINILNNTEDKGLIIAVPNSLARIENKLNQLK